MEAQHSSTSPQTDHPRAPQICRDSSLRDRYDALAVELRKAAHAAGVKFAKYLSDIDIHVAALNGLSEEINFGFPPAPVPLTSINEPSLVEELRSCGVPANAELVIAAENPMLFQHCLFSAVVQGVLSKSAVQDVLQTGFMSIGPTHYREYLDLLQSTAQFFDRERDAHLESAAELVAINAAESIRKCSNPLSAMQPQISIAGPHSSATEKGIMLTIGSHWKLIQSFAPGAVMFIAGAGYNSLCDFPAMMAARDYHFILNDRDPFVAKILEKTIEILKPTNIRFVGGEMSIAARHIEKVDGVIATNLYSSTREQLVLFLRALRETNLVLGSPLHIYQTNGDGPDIVSTGDDWFSALQEVGYRIDADQTVSGLVRQAIPAKRHSELRKLSGAAAELIARELHPQAKGETQMYRYLIGRLTAK